MGFQVGPKSKDWCVSNRKKWKIRRYPGTHRGRSNVTMEAEVSGAAARQGLLRIAGSHHKLERGKNKWVNGQILLFHSSSDGPVSNLRFRYPASRTVTEYIPMILSHQLIVLWENSQGTPCLERDSHVPPLSVRIAAAPRPPLSSSSLISRSLENALDSICLGSNTGGPMSWSLLSCRLTRAFGHCSKKAAPC